eukprot:TRINITY_DN3978_c0_g2_i1.p2 TRINITY_DN3978_c0_g2~~TRINITY_DN3978_c0_g2_i1.p2  ORF type:complete len:186 (+),score=62.51 TRINITY_DN3978_c0_g2_i1:67-624(+)
MSGYDADGPTVALNLARAEEFKARGTAAFKDGAWKKASFEYKNALNFCKSYIPDDGKSDADPALAMFGSRQRKGTEDEQSAAKTLFVSLHANIAMCKLKLADYEAVVKHASEALRLDPAHTKARFRRGTGYLKLKDVEKAEEDLLAVQQRDPESVKGALKELEAEKAAQKKKTDSLYRKMFAGGQ